MLGQLVEVAQLALTAWLAQQMNQTQITKLMRIGWETVGKIITRVAAEKLPAGRLDALALIGVDEVSTEWVDYRPCQVWGYDFSEFPRAGTSALAILDLA